MILYVNACARPDSRTDRLARALLQKLGPYEELRLYDEPLRPMDAHRIALRDALLSQKDYGAEMFRYARQFAVAEQIVLSAPLWDLSFPAQLKIYLENIFVTGIVTRYSEAGLPVGLCRAKKLYYVSTSGGPYDPRFGFDQLRAMATENFGIPEAELVKAELLDIDGCDPKAILHKAMTDYGLTETTDKEGGHAT